MIEDSFPVEVALVAKYGACKLEEAADNEDEADWEMPLTSQDISTMRTWRSTYILYSFSNLAEYNGKNAKFSDGASFSTAAKTLCSNTSPSTLLALATLDERAISRVIFAQLWTQIIQRSSSLVDDPQASVQILKTVGLFPGDSVKQEVDEDEAADESQRRSSTVHDLYTYQGDIKIEEDEKTKKKEQEADAAAREALFAHFSTYNAFELRHTAAEIEAALIRKAKSCS